MTEQNEKKIDRRELLARAGKAGALIGASGFVSYLMYGRKGPESVQEIESNLEFPDFSVKPVEGQTLSVVRGGGRVKGVNKAIDLLGGIERFVKLGETVLIKPNVAFATPAMLCATSNPELVAELARLCYKRGRAKEVFVLDNPINDADSCFKLTGIGKAASAAGAKVILPKETFFKNVTLAKGKLIRNWPVFFEPFVKADKVIGVSVIKDHHRSGVSMSMKNWYGLLGGRRNIFHQDVNTIITELSMMIRPSLVVLDGTDVMFSNGPTGGSLSDLRHANVMIASCDMVAADSYGCQFLDMKVSDLVYLRLAEQAGVGTADYEKLKPKIAEMS